MVGSEERRRLIDDYRDRLDERGVVARSVAGLLIVAVIAVAGATHAEPDDVHAARVRAHPDAAKRSGKADVDKVRANPESATVSGKRVATGR